MSDFHSIKSHWKLILPSTTAKHPQGLALAPGAFIGEYTVYKMGQPNLACQSHNLVNLGSDVALIQEGVRFILFCFLPT